MLYGVSHSTVYRWRDRDLLDKSQLAPRTMVRYRLRTLAEVEQLRRVRGGAVPDEYGSV
jgi:hypothetical protein